MTKLRNCEFQLYNGIFNSLPDIIRFFPKWPLELFEVLQNLSEVWIEIMLNVES